MPFNFNFAKVRLTKNGPKVHVCKGLLNLKDVQLRTSNELDILKRAVDYIKALEAEVIRLESRTIRVESDGPLHITSNDIKINAPADFDVAEFHRAAIEPPVEGGGVSRSLIGRLFGGNQ
jgi:hypothetical protein